MCENLSAKCFQENKEKLYKKSKDIKIFRKEKKNKRFMIIIRKYFNL